MSSLWKVLPTTSHRGHLGKQAINTWAFGDIPGLNSVLLTPAVTCYTLVLVTPGAVTSIPDE